MSTIAIIGGGIGGLVAGIALRQAGQEVTIYERAPAFGEVGAGISMSPNAVLGLRHIGLGKRIEALANEPLEQNQFHAHTGEVLLRIDRRATREKYGAPYLQLHRADLLDALLSAFGPENCVMGADLVGIESGDEGVALVFADGNKIEADVAIAADGLRSVVRETLFDTEEPIFSGHVAYRGLVPADRLSQRATEPININHLGTGRNIVSYPIRGTDLVNIVALSKAENWAEEGWSVRAEKSELQSHFADFAPYVQDLLAALPEDELFRWGLFVREPLKDWRKGRSVLLGDAAHAMLPYMGQGASCAIEDGVVLGRCFAECGGIDEALNAYVATRIGRASFLQRESNQGGDRLQAVDPDTFGKVAPVKNEDTLDIFAYDPATVPLLKP